MANLLGIYSVGASLVEHLTTAYPAELSATSPCAFKLLSTDQLAEPDGFVDDQTNLVSLLLYRITENEHLRHARRPVSPRNEREPLTVDLHYMVSIWGRTGREEHVIGAWVLRHLHLHPVLSPSTLLPDAGWGDDEVVQVIPAELRNEDLMRIWDALQPAYRLSKCYVARAVRIDPDEEGGEFAPVVARRVELAKAGREVE